MRYLRRKCNMKILVGLLKNEYIYVKLDSLAHLQMLLLLSVIYLVTQSTYIYYILIYLSDLY